MIALNLRMFSGFSHRHNTNWESPSPSPALDLGHHPGLKLENHLRQKEPTYVVSPGGEKKTTSPGPGPSLSPSLSGWGFMGQRREVPGKQEAQREARCWESGPSPLPCIGAPT